MPEETPHRPELVFGLVGPVGTDLTSVASALEGALRTVRYETEEIHVSRLLDQMEREDVLPTHSEYERYVAYMDAGDEFRDQLAQPDAMAALAIAAIREFRDEVVYGPEGSKGSDDQDLRPAPEQAYILRSIKRPEEVQLLKATYKDRFFLISVYSSRDSRVDSLAARISETDATIHAEGTSRAKAEELVARDEIDSTKPLGQDVRDAFPLADFFVTADGDVPIDDQLERLVELMFGYPFHTPTREEFGMFHARAAALRSADLGRQVGAVIARADGSIISVGTNEVPKAKGGQYWEQDDPDHRDFRRGGVDPSVSMRKNLIMDVVKAISDAGILGDFDVDGELEKRINSELSDRASPLRRTRVMDVTEFGRSVHAEMAAISEAALFGASVKSSTLFTTTFPCHNCARHIVAAGIERVVYIEPYPKSLAKDLYPDSIAVDGHPVEGARIPFGPFSGVSPQRYFSFFEPNMPRKVDTGDVSKWDSTKAMPKLVDAGDWHYLGAEWDVARSVISDMKNARLLDD